MINLATLLVVAMLFQSGPQDTAALKARAEAGDTKAQVKLGVAYASGIGVTASEREAVEWFRKAAEKGDAAGEYSLGEMYLTGRGVTADLAEGVKWMRRAAEGGDARGQFNLAAMYAQGQGVAKDDNEAAKWMRKAADQGLAAGQFGLGSMYAHGKGVPQSAVEAVNWYRKAGDQGDPDALNNLALLLATSTDAGVRNPKEAIVTAQRAVDANGENPACLDTLATAFYEAGQPDKAAEAERRAIALKPDDPAYKKALDKYVALAKLAQDNHPLVAFCTLVASGKEYDNKLVRTEALIQSGGHEVHVRSSECPSAAAVDRSASIEFPRGWNKTNLGKRLSAILRRDRSAKVRFEAIFESSGGPYGTEATRFHFVLRTLQSVQELADTQAVK